MKIEDFQTVSKGFHFFLTRKTRKRGSLTFSECNTFDTFRRRLSEALLGGKESNNQLRPFACQLNKPRRPRLNAVTKSYYFTSKSRELLKTSHAFFTNVWTVALDTRFVKVLTFAHKGLLTFITKATTTKGVYSENVRIFSSFFSKH